MLLVIRNLLSSANLLKAQEFMSRANYMDGKLTAGEDAKSVKDNLELAADDPNLAGMQKLLMHSILARPEFQYSALPSRVASPIFACYEPGMTYGDHVDNPIMGADVQYRSDVSLTLFISDPAHYQGGELVINTAFGEQKVKLGAGDMVTYPSSSLHRVNPVTSGKRMVMITFIQSMVRDPAKREILYNLWRALQGIKQDAARGAEAKLVDVSYVNLVRMWADP